jgi:hypothetical protein
MIARSLLVVVPFAVSCGPSAGGDGDDEPGAPDAEVTVIDAPRVDAGPGCPPPPNPAGADVELAPEFAPLYAAYDLGTVPGVPNPLGGAAVRVSDHDTLLIAGASETASGAIYAIGLERDACGHIIGFVGTAQQVASAPYVDANLVWASPELLVYSEWPNYAVGQLLGAATTPSRRDDLIAQGMTNDGGDQGPGGLGFVPPGLPAEDELRMVTWPGGRWYHVATTDAGGLLAIGAATQTTTLPNEPGGFAYVPAGSPGFTTQSLIVAEWRAANPAADRVAVYDVDGQGDPMPATRREFFTKFPRPWGAYFEPVTGDYLFLSWGTGADHVYVVQGFVPPPEID